MMAGIGAKNTKPEIVIRRGLHANGFRYRLHVPDLPGKPDIVFPRYNAVILVHGCFWHGHDCSLFKWPKSRPDFWRDKIRGNKARDASTEDALKAQGWRVIKIWECALKGRQKIGVDAVCALAGTWLQSDLTHGEIRGNMSDDGTD
jgi:DNA mismatch endonuclease, patch repair protein